MLLTATSTTVTVGTDSTVKPAGMIVDCTAAVVLNCVSTVSLMALAADDVGEVMVTMMRTDAATIVMEMRDAGIPSSAAKLVVSVATTAGV